MKKTVLYTFLFCVSFSAGSLADILKVVNQDQAVQLVKQQYPGKVLKVQSLPSNSYQIKLLSQQGVIYYFQVNAQTGQVSKK